MGQMLAGLMTVVLLQTLPGSPIVSPPNPPPIQTTVHTDVTVQVPPPDPEATAQMAGQAFSGILVTIIAPTLAKWAGDALDAPDFYRTTPPELSYRNPVVVEMADGVVRKVALALLALAVLAWGVEAVLRGYAGVPGRLVQGAALAAGNLTFWQWGIELNNRMNTAIAAPDLRSLVRPHLELPALTQDPAQAFAPAVLVIAAAIVCLLLLFTMFLRLAGLDVLIVAGSLALVCKSTEQTDRFVETYIGMATGTLFGQTLVVITLKLAGVLGVVVGGVTGTLLGLAMLLLARQMPGLLSGRFAQSSAGITGAAMRALVRRVIVRH